MKLKPRVPGGVLYVHFTDADGNRRRISTETADSTRAQMKALEIMREQFFDCLPSEERKQYGNLETLSSMLRQTLAEHWGGQDSEKTRKLMVAKIAREIGHWPRGALTYGRLRDYLDKLTVGKSKRPATPATKNRYASTIRMACTITKRRDPSFEIPEFPHWPENNVKERYLTLEEERRILAWFESNTAPADMERTYLRDLFVTLIDTGMRATEALEEMNVHESVKRGDSGALRAIWLKHGSTKSGRGRLVPLTERAQVAAEQMLASRIHRKWTSDHAGRRFRWLMEKLGIEGVTLHTLRHTCASRLVQAGVDIYLVSTWLGHSSLEVTKRYAHLAPETLTTALSALEKITRPTVVTLTE